LTEIGPVDCEPLTDLLPDQAPEAEHEVAFAADQVTVEALPELTVLGLACSVTSGAEAVTVTVTDWVAEPPGPVQVNSYSVVLVRLPVDQVLLVGTNPCQPPLAVHSVASVAVHVKMELAKLLIVVGEAANVIEGAGSATTACAVCTTEPPSPVQVSVKLVVDVRGSVDELPLVGCVPLQPPDAVQV
jgi:hypothetical protein